MSNEIHKSDVGDALQSQGPRSTLQSSVNDAGRISAAIPIATLTGDAEQKEDAYCIACWNCMPYLETCAVCGRVNTTQPCITQ